MRVIAGPGAVAGNFVDYHATTNPNGTVVTAQYGNDVQDELMGIQDYTGISEAAGTNEYVLAAIKKVTVDYGKHIGEMYYLDSLKTATVFDKDDPDTYFNGICLDAIDVSEDFAVANWADLVPHLRAKGLTYNEGITGEKSTFDVTDWDITSNVATLTFANTAGENAILAALLEDTEVHGSYTNWRSITIGTIGDITAGEYAITDVDVATREITFAFTAGDNSGSGAFTGIFYTNRVPGSTTTARLYEATGRTLVSANDGEGINGLRARDRSQGWQLGVDEDTTGAREYWGRSGGRDLEHTTGAQANNTVFKFTTTGEGAATKAIGKSDGTNGTPRTGLTTDPRSAVGHLYIHGRSYV